MTDDIREKARAVFLAFIMVVSIFGATVAFSGTAAAASVGSSSVDPTTVDNEGSVTHRVTLSQSSSGGADNGNEAFNLSSSSTIDSVTIVSSNSDVSGATVVSTSNVTFNATGGNPSVTLDVTVDYTGDTSNQNLNAAFDPNAGNSGGVSLSSIATITIAEASLDSGSSSVSPTTVDNEGSVTHTVTTQAGGFAATDADLESFNLSVSGPATITGASVTGQSGTGGGASVVSGTSNVTFNATSSTASVTLDVTIDWTGVSSGSTQSVTTGIDDDIGNGTAVDPTANTVGSVSIAAAGTDVIQNGTIAFQGLEEVQFGPNAVGSVTKVSGTDEGAVLSPPIPQDAATGQYDENGPSNFRDGVYGFTLDQPRVTTFEVQNQNGEDISGGAVSETSADQLTVVANYNYNAYEDLEVTVENSNGLDITDDVIAGTVTKRGSGQISWNLDLSNSGAGTYTVSVAGADDLDFGSATDSTTVEVTGGQDINIEAGTTNVTAGEDVRFEIRNSNAGDYHLVRISSNDFRKQGGSVAISTQNASKIFRNVGDVVERGVINTSFPSNSESGNLTEPGEISGATGDAEYAYAIVQIDDDGLGVGSIETEYLDTTSIDVEVSDQLNVDSNGDLQHSGADRTGTDPVEIAVSNPSFEEDSLEVTINEGQVTLNSPGGTYVVNSKVTVNGTAPASMDSVVIYARDEGAFQLVSLGGSNTTSVDADGTFTREDVVLSASGAQPGNSILRFPGTYRIGVISAQDADLDDDGDVDASLSTSEFSQGTSETRSLRVVGTGLTASFPSVVRGQIAAADNDFDVEGTAAGADEVVVVEIGSQGIADAQTVTVESDQTFSEEDISLGSISRGSVSLHVVSTGRDGQVGDGALPSSGTGPTALVNYVQNNLSNQGLTGDQMRSSLLSETVEDTASDDHIVSRTVRKRDAQTSILNVYQQGRSASGINPVAVGNTMVVEGQTNLQPSDNTIVVELSSQDTTVDLASTEQWGLQNGRWSVQLDTADAATGTYTLEADDGTNTDTVDVQLVEQLSTPTPTPTETPTPTPTATPTPTPTPTLGGGPGFGAVVAVIALLAAALLAIRRE